MKINIEKYLKKIKLDIKRLVYKVHKDENGYCGKCRVCKKLNDNNNIVKDTTATKSTTTTHDTTPSQRTQTQTHTQTQTQTQRETSINKLPKIYRVLYDENICFNTLNKLAKDKRYKNDIRIEDIYPKLKKKRIDAPHTTEPRNEKELDEAENGGG